MNKTPVRLIFYMIVFLALGAGTTVLSAASAAEKSTPLKDGEAGIVAVQGDVRLVMPSGARVPAQEGKRVPDGARLQTGPGSHAQVAFSPNLGKSVLVEQRSDVEVTPKDDEKVGIRKGAVFAVLDAVKPGTQFQLETPHGIAGVRGTVLRIIVISDDKSVVQTYEGTVAAFEPDMDELGSVVGGEKGYLKKNVPLFKERLSQEDVRTMEKLVTLTRDNIAEFRDMNGGLFDPRGDQSHGPRKTGHAGGKTSQRKLRDSETRPRDGFMPMDSREFIDNRYDRPVDRQQPQQERPQEQSHGSSSGH